MYPWTSTQMVALECESWQPINNHTNTHKRCQVHVYFASPNPIKDHKSYILIICSKKLQTHFFQIEHLIVSAHVNNQRFGWDCWLAILWTINTFDYQPMFKDGLAYPILNYNVCQLIHHDNSCALFILLGVN
jgi:hypothetical protein